MLHKCFRLVDIQFDNFLVPIKPEQWEATIIKFIKGTVNALSIIFLRQHVVITPGLYLSIDIVR